MDKSTKLCIISLAPSEELAKGMEGTSALMIELGQSSMDTISVITFIGIYVVAM